MNRNTIAVIAIISVAIVLVTQILTTETETHDSHDHEHGHAHDSHEDDVVRGPHGGRMLTENDFELEVTIYEKGLPPEFRVYAYHDNQPVPPERIDLDIRLMRTGDKTDHIGFTPQDHSSDGMEAIKKIFTPEFRNRLDGIVQFKPLSHEVIANVVDKFLFELEGQLHEKRVTIEVDQEARVWLAVNGYDDKMGARPMARLIQERIKKQLAEELLFGSLTDGGLVKIGVKDDDLHFEYEGRLVH